LPSSSSPPPRWPRSRTRENGSLLEQARDSARELQLLSQELGGAVGRFHIQPADDEPARVREPRLAVRG
jgi:hypothetical protein